MQNIRDLIARNELSQALQLLQSMLENTSLQDEAIQLSARLNETRRQVRLGLLDHGAASLAQNQIRAALLELLKETETLPAPPGSNPDALRHGQDAGHSMQNSKNVVSGSTISAGGNVHIGDKHITVIHQAPQKEMPDNPNLD